MKPSPHAGGWQAVVQSSVFDVLPSSQLSFAC
jgi:hypothetical protein